MDLLSCPKLDDRELYPRAAALARELTCRGRAKPRRELRQLRRARRLLRAFAAHHGAEEQSTAAAEWLLDNAHLTERESRAVLAALHSIAPLRLVGRFTLLYTLCRELVFASAGRLSAARIRSFLDGFQSVFRLQECELACLPLFLRLALLVSLAELSTTLPQRESEDHARLFSALFSSLRLLESPTIAKLLLHCDRLETILRADPTGEYRRMDEESRAQYRRRVAELALRAQRSEESLARELIEHARREGRHVGFYLFPEPNPLAAKGYVLLQCLLTLLAALAAGLAFHSFVLALLLALCLGEGVRALVDAPLSRLVAPRRLPRFALNECAEGGTVCVLCVLLSSPEAAARAVEKLERLFFVCRQERQHIPLCFALLADLPEADGPVVEGDAAILRAAREGIDALNERHGGGFLFLTRPREADGEGRFSPHERKRGALIALARELEGLANPLQIHGACEALHGCRFLLTLDADTQVYPGAVGALIAAMLHPLNRPVLDEANRLVTQGHAVLQPRLSTDIRSAGKSDFSLVFAPPGGSDPYGGLAGELYMDAFSFGGFCGKGLLDAHCLLVCTADRLEGRGVLSHDAPEGAYLRGGFLGDEEFFDDFPASALSYFRREHRWVRGDWQNLPFVFDRTLPLFERWRLGEKLLRSLRCGATLALLLLGFFRPERASLAAAAALLCLLGELFFSFAAQLRRRTHGVHLRRFSRVLFGFGGAIVRVFLRLWLLPYAAWVRLSAALTALWRLGVSRRQLLQWETAAQSAHRSGTLGDHCEQMLAALVVGLSAMLFSRSVIGHAAGLLWLFSPLCAWALSLDAVAERPLSEDERRYLLARAKDTWAYFDAFSVPADHYLPPDNVQESPPRGAAHQISPTNLGLALVAAVSACDLGIIPPARAVAYLGRILASAERLERHRGHFYNWYDTRTLLPLGSRILSTVDSGNCYACLAVAAAFLREQDESALAAKAERFLAEMDFSFLYDAERELFTISYNAAEERAVGGWYDLLASEAMLTSYLCCANGEAPRKHWRALGRSCKRKDGFQGLASWTGTMFEYLLPLLFLPVERGTLLGESCRFCLYAQKRRVPPTLPWGSSESAYFSLDAAQRYRYKAHGVAALALKRDQNRELVLAPYAAFLALALDPRGAVADLRHFERLGMLGRFGFYEALDCTPQRSRSREGEIVRSYMVHHAGMSLAAAANALCSGSIRRRFFGRSEMAAFAPLLQQRMGEEVVLRSRVPAQPQPRRGDLARHWQRRGGAGEEGFCVLSSGSYTLLLTHEGEERANWNDLTVSARRYGGVTLTLDGERLLPGAPQRWEMGESFCRYVFDDAALTLTAVRNGALYSLSLGAARAAELCFSFTPMLAPMEASCDHVAFHRLGIRAEARGNVVLLRRLGPDGHDHVLALGCDRPCSLLAEGRPLTDGEERTMLLPLAGLHLHLAASLSPRSVRLALCLADSAEEACADLQRALGSTAEDARFLSSAAALLGLGAAGIAGALQLAERAEHHILRNAVPRQALWHYGISGNEPLFLCDGGAKERERLTLQFCLYKSLGLRGELVFLSDEGREYARPLHRELTSILSRVGLEALLDSPGGIRILPHEAHDVLASRAALEIGVRPRLLPPLPVPPFASAQRGTRIPDFSFEGERFCFTTDGTLPPKPWQQIFPSASLGWAVSETGCGYLWQGNAREARINAPPLSPESVCGSEILWLESPLGSFSPFAAADGIPCRVRYAPGTAQWKKTIDGWTLTLTAFIDHRRGVRVLLLTGAEGLALRLRMALVLGAPDGAAVVCEEHGGLLRARNPESAFPELRFYLGVSSPAAFGFDHAESGFLLSSRCVGTTVIACGCDEAAVRALLDAEAARAALQETQTFWRERCCRLQLRSSSAALDHYLGDWCVYQTLCRLEARASLYQSGGAFGFRDQLQDAVNLLLLEPSLARERILDCCRHQYREGDVMHWWHCYSGGDRGVRTRCSDDLLWLCWALGEYCEATGDDALCAVLVPFLSSLPLREDERDRYEDAVPASESAPVLDHALCALRCCLGRGFGEHGLPLIGSGDWNDSLSAVEGESVWLGFFLCDCARKMAALLTRLGREGAEELCALAEAQLSAAESSFNGRWYERAYSKKGDMGLQGRRIDSLTQSWAAFCGARHAREAVEQALCRLVDPQTGLILLLDPPYGPEEPCYGYIRAYGEGVRENGGQYTHAALWLAHACFLLGRTDAGWELLSMMLSENKAPERYRAEPYVLAADLAAAPGHEGEGLWSWYTGSAGWFWRVATEDLLGLHLQGGKLSRRAVDTAAFCVGSLRLDGHER